MKKLLSIISISFFLSSCGGWIPGETEFHGNSNINTYYGYGIYNSAKDVILDLTNEDCNDFDVTNSNITKPYVVYERAIFGGEQKKSWQETWNVHNCGKNYVVKMDIFWAGTLAERYMEVVMSNSKGKKLKEFTLSPM